MKRIDASKARDRFAELIERAGVHGERIILRRYGMDLAAIIPAKDAAYLLALEDEIDNAAADRAMREKGANITYEAYRRSRLSRPRLRKAAK